MARNTTRNTTRRDRYRKQLQRGQPPCALCNTPIDYQAHYLDPNSYTIDHIVPLNAGGKDILSNLQPAHRSCNRTKSDNTDQATEPAWTTWRTW